MSKHQRAAGRFEAALSAHAEVGAAPYTAIAESGLAVSLHALGQTVRAGELAGHALRTARALGMRPLVERIEAGPEPAEEASRIGAGLTIQGELWVASAQGSEVRLRDRKGIAYLARLLERRHLAASVRTDSYCRYAPAAGEEVRWRVERPR